jgi:hypothetical protein
MGDIRLMEAAARVNRASNIVAVLLSTHLPPVTVLPSVNMDGRL